MQGSVQFCTELSVQSLNAHVTFCVAWLYSVVIHNVLLSARSTVNIHFEHCSMYAATTLLSFCM